MQTKFNQKQTIDLFVITYNDIILCTKLVLIMNLNVNCYQ